MQVKTFIELIEWTRTMHEKQAQCMAHCASRHSSERASGLLEYLASHEIEMEKMVAAFEQQADFKAAHTLTYDYTPHIPIMAHMVCDDHYARLDSDAISAEFFVSREQIVDLYRTLLNKAVIPEAEELMQALLDMEVNETKLMSTQVGRMDEM